MKLTSSRALGIPGWHVQVRWPDGEQLELEVVADDAAAAERYARDVWGESITVTASPVAAA